jgi:RNA polymerase sigma factor (sigma-70 family)
MADTPPIGDTSDGLVPSTAKDRRANGDSTQRLIERAREGDRQALDTLYARHLPALMRWASGRLPRWSRDVSDTVDLVQETLLTSFKHLHRFDCRGEGALLAYLRQGIINRIKDEQRNAARRPPLGTADSRILATAPSPLEEVVGQEGLRRYEAALQRLHPDEREAIIARVELGKSFPEIAAMINKPSRDAARMLVTRALVKLAEEMEREERR